MTPPDATWWARARRARDHLAAEVMRHPDVRAVDIGGDPEASGEALVLRVHVRRRDPPGLSMPEAVDGIPVRVIRGDYQPEQAA